MVIVRLTAGQLQNKATQRLLATGCGDMFLNLRIKCIDQLFGRCLIHTRRGDIPTVLMQYESRRSPLCIRLKRNLGIDDVGKKVAPPFWKHFHGRLTCKLHPEVLVIAIHGHDQVRWKRIVSDIRIEELRVHRHRLACRDKVFGRIHAIDNQEFDRNLLQL